MALLPVRATLELKPPLLKVNGPLPKPWLLLIATLVALLKVVPPL